MTHGSMETGAMLGYNAYGKKANWLTYDKKPMPQWDDLGAEIKRRWIANFLVIAAYLSGRWGDLLELNNTDTKLLRDDIPQLSEIDKLLL